VPSHEVAARFGYTAGSFRVLCHEFRQDPTRPFFLASRQGPRPTPTRDRIREQIITLRKRNLSIYDISRALAAAGTPRSPVAVSLIVKAEGFARLPRRPDGQTPSTRHQSFGGGPDKQGRRLAGVQNRPFIGSPATCGALKLLLTVVCLRRAEPPMGSEKRQILVERSARMSGLILFGKHGLALRTVVKAFPLVTRSQVIYVRHGKLWRFWILGNGHKPTLVPHLRLIAHA
jgi:hypothetical protein